MQGWKRKSESKKKFDRHRKLEKKQRKYYDKNTKLARKDRKLVDKNYIQKQGKVEHCSVNATAHYSNDLAQSVWVPHHDQQPSQEYFITRYKVHLAGVHNEATKEQINYVIGESELLNKGPNGVLSLVFNAIKQFNRGEKHLKINCDNSAGQNKNKVSLWFYSCLVIKGYHETIEQNFMMKGHNKSKVDGNFGMIKRRYKKSTVYNIEQFAEVVRKSSPEGYNKVQLYENGKGFNYYDFKEKLEPYFARLPSIGKYHHFLIENSNFGVVKVKEFVDSPWIEIDLLKDDGREREEVIEEIRNLVFTILTPKPLSLERQEYLHKKIRPLLPEKYWNTLPLPVLQC